MSFAVGCLVAYLVGGIPFALLLVRVFKGVDVRTLGSGNVGATNASRAFGGRAKLPIFLLIYLLDTAKGFVPAFFGPALVESPAGGAVILGACAVVGHCASPYLGFRGGKGVATTTGVVLAVEPVALLVALAAFFVVFGATRKVFLGSLALGVALPLAIILRETETAFDARLPASLFALAIAGFLFFTHRSNLANMLGK